MPITARIVAVTTATMTLKVGLGLFFARPLFHAPSIISARTANPAPNHAPTLTCNMINSTGVNMIMLTSEGTNPAPKSQSTTLCERGIPIAMPMINRATMSFNRLLICSETCLNKFLISGSILNSSLIHSSSHKWEGVESMKERPACFNLFKR